EHRRIDTVVDKRCPQRDLAAPIAGWRRKCRKVACQNSRRGNKRDDICRILPEAGALIAAEEEQLVLHNWSASGSTELVSFNGVPLGRKCISRIEHAISNK